MMKILLTSLSIFLAMTSMAQAAPGHSGTTHDHPEATAYGQPGDAKKPARVVHILMNDKMRYVPDVVTVKAGENIRFVVKNVGAMKHEMVIGTRKDLEEHAALMQKFPEMEHADPEAISLDPSKSGDLFWKFTKAGTYYLGCLMPGHFEAGMVATVVVK